MWERFGRGCLQRLCGLGGAWEAGPDSGPALHDTGPASDARCGQGRAGGERARVPALLPTLPALLTRSDAVHADRLRYQPSVEELGLEALLLHISEVAAEEAAAAAAAKA